MAGNGHQAASGGHQEIPGTEVPPAKFPGPGIPGVNQHAQAGTYENPPLAGFNSAVRNGPGFLAWATAPHMGHCTTEPHGARERHFLRPSSGLLQRAVYGTAGDFWCCLLFNTHANQTAAFVCFDPIHNRAEIDAPERWGLL